MGTFQLRLSDAAVVGLEDLEAEGLGGSITGSDTFESMPEVAPTAQAVVLRGSKIQGDQLVALAGVLQGSLVRGLDPHFGVLAVKAAGALTRPGIHGNRIIAINMFDLQLRKA